MRTTSPTCSLHLAPEGQLNLDFEDEITAGACITHEGRIVNERVRETVEGRE